jgi:hypothetical protein
MSMDLRAIRRSIAAIALESGFSAWDYAPDDPSELPAAVVGGIKQMRRMNRLVCEIQIGVTFYASQADPIDATSRLDNALSTGTDGGTSFLDNLDAADDAAAGWRSIRFLAAGPYAVYAMPGNAKALGVEVILELTA